MLRAVTKAVFALLIVASCSITAFAARNPALEGLEVLRRGFAGTTDFTADIVQEKQLALMKRKLVSRGVVRFRKPGTFYMELYPPTASRVLLTGNVMTMRLPGDATSERVVLPPEQSLTRWLAYLAKPVTALPAGVDVTAERQGKGWTVRLAPKGEGGVKALQITFDDGGRIRRLAIEERNRDRTVIRFATFRRNVGLTEKDFTLE